MASLDLSAAIDVANIELLRKRLDIIGIPSDVVSLIETWLAERMFYMSINDNNSYFIAMDTGIIQGSIWGPFCMQVTFHPYLIWRNFQIMQMTTSL